MSSRVDWTNLPVVDGGSSQNSERAWFQTLEPGVIQKIFVTFLILFSAILLFSTVLASSEEIEDQRSTVEGFSLFRYDEDLAWKLSGNKANRGEENLVVQGFDLIVKRSDTQEEKILYDFSGGEIRLKSGEKSEVAVIPEEFELTIEGEITGTAGSARYDFTTGVISGNKLNIARTGKGDGITLAGENFEYDYRRKELSVTGGFRATIDNAGNQQTELSGDRLTWIQNEEIYTKGNVVARTSSGWKLTSEEMRWNPGKETLTCSGPVVAVRDEARVRGESMTYYRGGSRIIFRKGEMTLRGK